MHNEEGLKSSEEFQKERPADSTNITVLMAVFNGARFLREAMDSVLRQTCTDFEFLIVNDGSTDETRQTILSYGDPRIRLVDNERNLGLAPSLNRGLRLAKGEFIARMDADDISEPQRLERQLAFLRANPQIALLGTACREIDADGNVLYEARLPNEPVDIRWRLVFSCPFYHSAVMFRRRAVLEEVGLYDESQPYAMDTELWMRIAQRFDVTNLDEPLVRYRRHGDSLTAKYGEVDPIHLALVCELLGWDARDLPRNRRRLEQMTALLYDDFEKVDLIEAPEAADELLRLHGICRNTRARGEGDWDSHYVQLSSQILRAIDELAKRNLGAAAARPVGGPVL